MVSWLCDHHIAAGTFVVSWKVLDNALWQPPLLAIEGLQFLHIDVSTDFVPRAGRRSTNGYDYRSKKPVHMPSVFIFFHSLHVADSCVTMAHPSTSSPVKLLCSEWPSKRHVFKEGQCRQQKWTPQLGPHICCGAHRWEGAGKAVEGTWFYTMIPMRFELIC
jgi:hypothetical protein